MRAGANNACPAGTAVVLHKQTREKREGEANEHMFRGEKNPHQKGHAEMEHGTRSGQIDDAVSVVPCVSVGSSTRVRAY
jgi:hypothetical protein